MSKDLSKNFEAYNLPHIIRDAVIFYGKDGDVTISDEQEVMLKEKFNGDVPKEVKYKKEIKIK